MSNPTALTNEPRLPSSRKLLLVAFFSMPFFAGLDWLTDSHDLTVRKYAPFDGEIVETSTSTSPIPFGVRLNLTLLHGIAAGLGLYVVTWCCFRMRLSWWRIQHPSDPIEPAGEALNETSATIPPPLPTKRN